MGQGQVPPEMDSNHPWQLRGPYGAPTMLFFLQGVCSTCKGIAFHNDNNDKKMITIEPLLFFFYLLFILQES